MRIDEVINGGEKITLGEFMDIIKRVKIKVLISILSILITIGYGIFKFGQNNQLEDTAVSLGYPFKMSVEKDLMASILQNDPGDKVNLGTLSLALNPAFPITHEGACYTLHKINEEDETDIRQIGTIVAQKRQSKRFFSTIYGQLEHLGAVYAQDAFDWFGHQNNRQYQERYSNANTVLRYYDDGWVLEYKLDAQGRSIPSSFKWIKKG